MASKHSKIQRSIQEMKSFLDYHYDEYKDAYTHIRSGQGWKIQNFQRELFDLNENLFMNLYEELYIKLKEGNPATDEEILNQFKSLLKFFEDSDILFINILEKKDDQIFETIEGIIRELLYKAIYKLREVIQLAQEDLIRSNESVDIQNEFLIGIVTATSDEYKSVKSLMVNGQDLPTEKNDTLVYHKGVFEKGDKRINVILTQCHHQGMASSTSTTTKMILRFKPSIIAMLGHAAGNKNIAESLGLGAIMICSESVDYHQLSISQKTNSDGEIEIREKDRKITIPADSALLMRLERFCETSIIERIKDAYKYKEKFEGPLNYKVGKVITGDVLARSEEWFNKVMTDNSGAIGLDMETYGVYYAAMNTIFADKPIFISIKSVSDFGSHNERWSADLKKPAMRIDYAVYTSSRFFYEFALEHLPLV